jgi:hypothetical protein
MKETTKTSMVTASSLAYWAAAKFAKENNKPEIFKAIQALFEEQSSNAVAEKFIQDALSGMNEAILPFAREPIDIYATAINIKKNSKSDFVFFDAVTQVEAGYFKVSENEVMYIDSVQPLNEIFEYFSIDQVALTLQVLKGIDAQPPILTMYEDDESDLQVHTNLKSFLTLKDNAAEATLYIFNFQNEHSSNTNLKNLKLGNFLIRKSQEGFTLKINLAEKLLELHAASLQGYWLLIHTNEFEFVCELPNFTEDRQVKVGWIYPVSLMQSLTPGSDQVITVDLQKASKLFGHHRWFGCNTIDQWLKVIAVAEQH